MSKSIVGDLSPLKPTGQEEIGSVLYSHGEEGNRSTHSHLMTEIKAFPEDSVRAPTKCAESVGGAGPLVEEMMVRDVETFDKVDLRPTETQEPMTGAELVKKEFETKSINAEVASFDKADLRETEVEVKNVLPNEKDIKLEREKVELIGGIENFDVDNLARVTVREPVSGAELLKQELGHRAVQEEIGVFNQDTLKATQVKEGGWLPDQQVIQEEKDKVDHLARIEGFHADDLNNSVVTFDSASLRAATTEEKVLLPDAETLKSERERASLMANIESGDHALTPVSPKEPLGGAELTHSQV